MKVLMLIILSLCVAVSVTATNFEPCRTKAARLSRARAQGKLPPGAEIPKCDSDKTYAAVQCKGSLCFCVDRFNKQIRHGKGIYARNRWQADNMNCNCARAKNDYEKLKIRGFIYYCTNDGSFEKIQCIGSVCHCVDKTGKEVGSYRRPIYEFEELLKICPSF